MIRFEAALVRPAGSGTWTYVPIPFSVEQTFGTRGQFKVAGTVNGCPIRGSLMPRGDGTHYLVVNKNIRDSAGVTEGDMVQVTIGPDTEERTIDVPGDFLALLQADAEADQAFAKLSYSHRKEYVDWIVSAKKEETRANRIAKAVEMLKLGKRAK
ncbi:YdeI/OmpD-associated family protein [Paenibacillus ginsengarvi]|uniref:DUF1905 domain-containing protein n=1 Tax=Paenibacillus ginsengarvi TaxID=400777 RepID=A0A3B0CUJ4_9BACL|nr:YdeI/OmpD-associated family protein [Paenibacillus ginsengarvi]RKN86974.1 DUF1905 domain-containing protein [Paenibacillus ginsengarvi]